MNYNKLNKRIVFFLTILFLLLGSVVYYIDQSKMTRYPSLRVEANCSFLISSPLSTDYVQKIRIWHEANEDKYYLFIPGYSDLSHTELELISGVKLYIDGRKWESGSNLGALEYQKEYCMQFSNMKDAISLTIIPTGGVATMYLETNSAGMDYLNESKDHKLSGMMTILTEDGKEDYSGKIKSIKGHGNTSWRYSMKKPFSITLSQKGDLLGMGESKKWIMINNYNEITNLNNKLIYEFARDVGLEYSPDCQYVDTYINGIYYGVYLLSERIHIAENRVEVKEPGNVAGSSYLVTMNLIDRAKRKGKNYIQTKGKYCMSIVSPSNASDALKDEIGSDFQSLENALYSEDGIDPESGKSWDEMIDLDSWVKKYLIEEVFENVDGCKLSQYFYKNGEEGDNKIYAGPVWDYNSAWGNPHTDKPIQNPVCLRSNREWLGYKNLHNWFFFLYHQEKFYNRMVEIYQKDYLPVLEKMMTEKMPAVASHIKPSSDANLLRWKVKVDGYTSVEDDYDKIYHFLEERIAYLNSDWIEGKDYSYISTRNLKNGTYRHYAIPRGEIFPENTIPEPYNPDKTLTFAGWYDESTDQPYDFSQPVDREYLNLYGKWE